MELLRKADAERPDAPEVMSRLGITLRATKRHQEAIECFEKAIRDAPQDRMSHYNLALTLEEADRPQEAIRRIEQAADKWPEFSLASEMLSRLRRAYPKAC